MATKRDSGEWAGPRRLPSVREKLSGFVKRGRGLAKKSTLSLIGERSQRPSLDESQKALPRVEVQAFGTSSLEIDLTSLEAFRDVPMPPPQKRPEHQEPPPTTSSTTPIADMFSAKRTPLTEPSPVSNNYSLNKSSPSLIDALKKSTRAEDRLISSQKTTETPDPVANVTVINLTHSVPQNAKPWPPPEKPRAAVSNRIQANKTSDSKQPGRIQLREQPRRAAFVPSGPAAINMPPMSRPRLNADMASEIMEKRYSTPPAAMSSLGQAPTSVPAETIRSDRRRSWQPAPTSVPSGSSTPSAPPSASAPWRNGMGNRRISPRLATDRLAWIKELEEGKKKSSINGDIPVLKSVQGSVADKLARFEQKQQQTQLAPITRSNSTRSRMSSVADTTFSSYGDAATSRSSLDSHRASSVFSHYDDTFREKMELVAGRKGDEEAEEKPALQKVTASFVSISKRDKQASVDAAPAVEKPQGVEEIEKTGDVEKAVDGNVEEPQVEVPKAEETLAEEPKVEEPKVEDAQVEEAKVEEAQVEDAQVEEAKVEEAKVEEAKVEETEVAEPKVEEPKTESLLETEAVEAEKVEEVQKIENSENVEEVQNTEKVELVEADEKVENSDVAQVVEEVPEVVASKDVVEVQVADQVDAADETPEIVAAQPAEEPQAI